MCCEIKEKSNTIKYNPLFELLKYVYSFFLFIVFLICMIFGRIEYANKRIGEINNNLLLVLFGMVLFIVLYLFIHKIKLGGGKKCIVGLCILFFVLQALLIEKYYFFTRWDVAHVFHSAEAVALSQPERLGQQILYFSLYPNNLFLVYLFACVIKIANLFGYNNYYFSLIVFQCLLSGIAGVLVYNIVIEISNNRHQALFAFVVYQLLTGLSPWISVPYSDSVGLFFPAFLLFMYIKVKKAELKEERLKALFLWVLISFFSVIAFQIKPQCCIVGISFVIIEGLSFKFREIRRFFIWFLCVAIGAYITFSLSSAVIGSLGIKVDSERAIGITHFLMMGLNERNNGAFYSKDSVYSAKIHNKKERMHENLRVAVERVNSYKAYGLLKHFCKKTLTVFNDGTFCWGGEGEFYDKILPDNNNRLSIFLRNIYYNNKMQGKYYKAWSDFAQSVWITTLGLTVLMAFVKRNKVFMCISLSLFGLWLFELLFEARARYLFSYVPFFVIAGSFGMETLYEFVQKSLFEKSIPSR